MAREPLKTRPTCRPVLIVVVLSALITVSHLVLRTGFVLDDWFPMADGRFGGMWKAGTVQAWSRPGQWLVYAFTFGIFGRHPIFYVLVLGATSVVVAVLLLVLLRGFLPPTIALLVTIVWVWLPNHTTMEVWASAVNINVAVLAVIVGLLVGLRPARSPWQLVVSAMLLAFAMLTYEATIPAAVGCVVLLPVVRRRRVDWTWIGATAVSLGAAVLWMLAHWNSSKSAVWDPRPATQFVEAHFGWGVVPEGIPAAISMAFVLIVSVLVVERIVVSRRRQKIGPAEWCVISGWIVILLSLLPFLLYVYGPLGAGDRVNCVSSIGGALVWTGIFMLAWQARRKVAVVGAAALLVAAGVSRVDRTVTWSVAFQDADRILTAMHRQIPKPTGVIVIGPSPIQRSNIAAFLDNSNIDTAAQVEYGKRTVHAEIAYGSKLFFSIPRDLRIDIRPLSRLKPDVNLSNDRNPSNGR